MPRITTPLSLLLPIIASAFGLGFFSAVAFIQPEAAPQSPGIITPRNVPPTTRPHPSSGSEYLPKNSESPAASSPLAPVQTSKVAEASENEEVPASTQRIEWKVSAISKFVPITVDQRERLVRTFQAQTRGEAPAETMEDILGAEGVALYKSEVKAAFARAARESREKDVYYVSRKLGLDSVKENELFRIYEEVDVSVSPVGEGAEGAGKSRTEEVKAAVEEERRKQKLLLDKAKEILTADQYEAFAGIIAESTGSDMQVFHSQ